MLGWHFIVSVPPIIKQSQVVAMWDGGMGSDQWLHDAIAEKKADALSVNGGYPNTYIVAVEVLPPHVERTVELLNAVWCIVEVWDQS